MSTDNDMLIRRSIRITAETDELLDKMDKKQLPVYVSAAILNYEHVFKFTSMLKEFRASLVEQVEHIDSLIQLNSTKE